jgi:hypothetical protein
MTARLATDNQLGWAYNNFDINCSSPAFQNMNLTEQQSAFGPSFGGKCFFGLNDFMMKNASDFNFQIWSSPGGNWADLH